MSPDWDSNRLIYDWKDKMKISELVNAPAWLVNAVTENADVEISAYGWVTWNSGNFLGGNFLGGNFRGLVARPRS